VRNERERLLDILEAIERIEKYVISGMRNILVHHYFEIDEAIVWAVIERDLPDIKSAVTTILPTMPDTPNSRAMPDAS
jgi:uncharacterized protein with HEPN domain